VEIQIIHEATIDNPNSFEEVEIWMDLYMLSYEDTHDTPGGSDITIKQWGIIKEHENGTIEYSDEQPEWITSKMLDEKAEEAFGRYKDIADEDPFADY
jgi:hypothetical protein